MDFLVCASACSACRRSSDLMLQRFVAYSWWQAQNGDSRMRCFALLCAKKWRESMGSMGHTSGRIIS